MSPLVLVNAITRNLVPLAGILFFGWSAANVLVLYFADTIFAMVVMLAGLMRHLMPSPRDEGVAARVNAEAGYVATALFLGVVFAVPLGVPLIFMLAGTDVTVPSLFADPAFRSGLVLQAIAAFWSGHGLYQALKVHTPEELRLRRQFALVLMRWMAVLMATYFGIAFLFGRFAPLIFVAVYAGVSIFIDIAPDKFLRAWPGGKNSDTPPGSPNPGALPSGTQTRRKRKR
jgi:hypothetical protein